MLYVICYQLLIVCCACACAAAAPGLLDYGYAPALSHSVVAAPVYKTYAAPVVKAVAPVSDASSGIPVESAKH